MNLLMLAVGTQAGAVSSAGLASDSCALFLFVAGAVSMTIAGYLLYRAPQAQPVRYGQTHRR